MKRVLLLLLIFASTLSISAQRLLETDNNWNLLDVIWLNAETNNYRIGSDTTINGMVYQQILKNGAPVEITNPTTPRFMRETDDGKVYMNNHLYGDTDEVLIYDFGLMVADTFILAPSADPILENKFVVTSIDTVLMLNGALRRQLTLNLIDSQFGGTLVWIEGIGDINDGPFYGHTYYVFDVNSTLLCAHQMDTIMTYQNPDYESCFVTITSTEKTDVADPVKIYPNPVEDWLTLEFLKVDNEFEEFCIYNTLGASIYYQKNSNNFSRIDMSQWTAGIYYLVLKDKSGVRFSQRIVKR